VCYDEYDAKISELEREASERDTRISDLESQLDTLMADFVQLQTDFEAVNNAHQCVQGTGRRELSSRHAEMLQAVYSKLLE